MNTIKLFLFSLLIYFMQILFCTEYFTFEMNQARGTYKINKKDKRSLSGSTPIYGNSSALNYYYVNIYIGTPPQKQSVIIDTGSHLTAVPCLPFCVNCGRHMNPYYDMKKSNSSRVVNCNWDNCKKFSVARCEPDEKCFYSTTYGEGSTLSGFMIEDLILFGDTFHKLKPVNLPLGCTSTENKLFYDQDVDGIMGLGPGSTSFVNLLYNNSIIPNNIFSLCFATNGGYFSIGHINSTFHKDSIKYIKYYESNFYKVKLTDIIINHKDFLISESNYYTIIDSGTTLSYFPRILYTKIEKQINTFCSQLNKCLGDSYPTDLGICYKLKENISIDKFVESMPLIKFIFEGKVRYDWNPQNYLFNYTELTSNDNRITFCIGMTGWNSNEILLGSSWMHNHDIIFDLEGNRIGLVESNCGMGRNMNDFGVYQFYNEKLYLSCEVTVGIYLKLIVMICVISVILILTIILLFNRFKIDQEDVLLTDKFLNILDNSLFEIVNDIKNENLNQNGNK